MKICYAFLFFILFSLSGHLSATTVIPFKHLGEATQASEAVVLATVESLFETRLGDRVFFDCSLRVLNAAKGALLPDETFILRRHSFGLGDFTANIAGDFVPLEGKTYLLFLQRTGDVWRPITLSYYVFEIKKMNGERFLVPLEESAGIAYASRSDGVRPEPPGVYRVEALLAVLEQYANGTKRVWDVTPALTGILPTDFPHERVLPTGCDFTLSGGPLSRWEDAAVEVYFDDTDAPAGFSGTLDAILGSMNSNYTGIDAGNGGQTGFTPDCTDNSVAGSDFTAFLTGLNGTQATLIFFEDPCSQIANLNSCNGTLAIGGSYSSSSTHSYKGDTWNDALWGFVVVNNGVLDCLDPDEYEMMLTHELTHTYRMDHLDAGSFPNQNMNPSCCNAINFKDIECMNYTYDLAAPVELIAFDAQPYDGRQVRVSWTTASEKNNHHFAVEHSTDGLHFETVKTVSGNNSPAASRYEWIDPLPAGGLNYYRLSQVDFDGNTTTFGLKAVNMGENDAVFRIFPNPAPTATITVLVDVPVAFNGTMEIINPDGRVLAASTLVLESGRNRFEQSVEHLGPGLYWLKLREADYTRILKFFKN